MNEQQIEFLVDSFTHAISECDATTITYEELEKVLHLSLQSLDQ